MTISVQIDSNAWNFLFDRAIDLNHALPPGEFSLFITREVEIEINAIPDEGKDGTDKRPLKQYIRDSLGRNAVRTTARFGFAEANPVGGPAVYGGFGQGTFQSDEERAWYRQDKVRNYMVGKSKKGSGLSGNQADTAVAAASFHCVVLTCDKKAGPICEAVTQGGNVIFLSDALLEVETLGQIVRAKAGQ
ncbi:hypothetical protein [Burkholderia vietnamiensis]|uniref:hypothetical protein n=1 Tax=Burkholderia vietnamiensis TaxID=60552 RepID=UPI000D851502|nr:hypothetical protein [Burkholderia vietnamiensis]GBH26107.1 hypothetical protein BvRS1_31560 [Burkholderia vietnamiensis]